MNILHERTLEKQVNNTSRKSHIPSSVWLQNWRAESIWYVVNLDLNFASLLVWFSCPLASNVQFLTFSKSKNPSIWHSPDTSLWCIQKCHFPNHGISFCLTAWLLCSPVSIPLIFFVGAGAWSPCPFPNCLGWHSVSSLPCPQFTRQLAALHLGKIPLTSWETSFSSLVPAFNLLSMNLDKSIKHVIGGYRFPLWLELLGILIFHTDSYMVIIIFPQVWWISLYHLQ